MQERKKYYLFYQYSVLFLANIDSATNHQFPDIISQEYNATNLKLKIYLITGFVKKRTNIKAIITDSVNFIDKKHGAFNKKHLRST